VVGKPIYKGLVVQFEKLTAETAELKESMAKLKDTETIHHQIINTTSEGFLLLDTEYVVKDANATLLRILDFDKEALMGRRFDTLYDKRTVGFYYANRDHLSFEALFSARAGRKIPMLFNRSTLRDDQDRIISYVCFLTDLTELKVVQTELNKAEQRYRRIYENAVQGMFQVTLSGRILDVNPAYARLLGYSSPEEMIAEEQSATRFYDNLEDRQKMIDALKEHGALIDYELKLKRKDGATIWTLANFRLAEDDSGLPILEGILVDNTARKLMEEELRSSREIFRQLSVRDNLTGLYNTRYLYQKLDDLIADAQNTGMSFSLIFMDMDNFKRVVDTYGHLNGSKALQEVAATIRLSLCEPAFGVAYGGDEFVVVLPGLDKPQAIEKAEEIRNRMRETDYLVGRGYHVKLHASFGIATFPNDAPDKDGLLALADQAMFHVKEKGKDAVGSSP
jgi:diguanylate cyclase (GGDEF)-like protein/PAS domain S-box-containing protein